MNDDGRPDAELLADAARGNGAAFAVLVRRHIRAATLLAAQLLGDRDDAEDIVQVAFATVYRKARAFDPARPFAPWFFSIVRRLAGNKRSRDARRARLLRLWGTRVPGAASSRDEDAVLARVDAAAVTRAMKSLPAMQRACFELVVVRDLAIDDVAAMHGISESTVRQHVFRARAALRTVLEGKHDAR